MHIVFCGHLEAYSLSFLHSYRIICRRGLKLMRYNMYRVRKELKILRSIDGVNVCGPIPHRMIAELYVLPISEKAPSLKVHALPCSLSRKTYSYLCLEILYTQPPTTRYTYQDSYMLTEQIYCLFTISLAGRRTK